MTGLPFVRARVWGWVARRGRVAAVAGSLLVAGQAGAELLVYEPFSYGAGPLGSEPTGGVNLAGPYTQDSTGASPLVVVSPGLNYGSLGGAPAAAGNRLSQDSGIGAKNATVNVAQDVLTSPGTEVFFSALFQFDDTPNGNRFANVALVDADTGDEVRFGQSVVGLRAIRVEAQTAATGGQTAAAGADNSFADGQTLLLIGRYLNSAALDGDVLQLVGYDTANAITLPPTFNPADPNAAFSFTLDEVDVDLAKISALRFTIRGDANNFLDELRVGNTYAAVPEPAGTALLAAAMGALACRRRRRRRRPGT